jgi:hypothetical protein
MANQPIWSDALGWALLASLPDETLGRQWGPAPAGAGEPLPGGFAARLRRDLLSWAGCDEEVRRWVLGAWREAHPDVVAAADQAVTAGLPEDAVRALASFPMGDALLALLTDEIDDGRQLAKTFVSRVEDDSGRRALSAALERLVGDGGGEPPRRPRVVILGGLERLGSELGQRLFADSPFEVRWRACEKKPSSGSVQKVVAGALRNADAAVIITGMASHMLMQFAKDYARRAGIRWRCVEKATDVQLKAALRVMFPELSAGWE